MNHRVVGGGRPPDSANRAVVDVSLVFTGLLLATVVSSANLTVIAPALPVIAAELGAFDRFTWIPLALLVSSAVAVPIVGKMSDIYGRKYFGLAGLLTVVVASLLAALAPTFHWLLAVQVLQGIGLGTIHVTSRTILGMVVPSRERARYQAIMSAVAGASIVSGPIVGGFVLDQLGWRWLFLVNLPFALMSLVIMFVAFPRRAPRPGQLVDVTGMATLAIMLATIVLAVGSTTGGAVWTSPPVVGLLVLGAIATGLFVLIERKAPNPVLPLKLWTDRVFTLSSIAAFGVYASLYGATYFLPVYAQGVLRQSASESGKIITPLLLSHVVTTILLGEVITRTGRYKALMLTGIPLLVLGFSTLATLGPHATMGDIVRAAVMIGVGFGASSQIYVLVMQNSAAREDMGVVTSTVELSRTLGGAVGVAIIGAVFTGGLADNIASQLATDSTTSASSDHLAAIALDATRAAVLSPPIADALRAGVAQSLQTAFLMALPLVVLAFVASVFIPERPLRRAARYTHLESSQDGGRQ